MTAAKLNGADRGSPDTLSPANSFGRARNGRKADHLLATLIGAVAAGLVLLLLSAPSAE